MSQLLSKECRIDLRFVRADKPQVIAAKEVRGVIIGDCRDPNVVRGFRVLREQEVTGMYGEAVDFGLRRRGTHELQLGGSR